MLRLGNVTEEDVFAFKAPENTNTYESLSHRTVIETLQAILSDNGYVILSKTYRTSTDGDVCHGRFLLDSDNVDLGKELQFLNSYNKTKCLTIAIGSHVFVCENGMVMGEYAFKHRHSNGILQFFNMFLYEVLQKIEDMHQESITLMEAMKRIFLTNRERAGLIGEMLLEDKIITSSQIETIESQHKESEFFNDNSLWSLYNNVTEALKDSHPSNAMRSYAKLTDLARKQVELIGV